MHEYHGSLLVNIIRDRGTVSRAELARLTHMSPTSVGRIVKGLLEQGLVQERGQVEGPVGRRATLLTVNPSAVLVVGVDVNKPITDVGVVDLDGHVLASCQIETSVSQDPDVVTDGVVSAVQSLLGQLGPQASHVTGVGIGVPGIVDWPGGINRVSPQFGWRDYAFREIVEKRLNLITLVDNAAKAAALAESMFGVAKDCQHFLRIVVGSGVGSALVSQGGLFRGVTNSAGEIGHSTVDPCGPLCDCGRRGCLQTYVCAPALEKLSGRSIKAIFAAADAGEPWAESLLGRAVSYLGMAISNAACSYNPEKVVLGGSMFEQHPELVELVNDECRKYLWQPLADSFQLVRTGLGEHAGVVGAASLVIRERFLTPIDIRPSLVPSQ